MSVELKLLGGFEVVIDGEAVPAEAWSRRQAASLVKLLALADDRRMHREQVIEALWPGVAPEAAAPRLHKAAHYARKALGDDPAALALRSDLVLLFPGSEHDSQVQAIDIDVASFRSAARSALAARSEELASNALRRYGGLLLPEDLYEPWTEVHRSSLQLQHQDLLRLVGRWEELLREEPADEQAHLALARAAASRADPRAGLRQLERLERATERELGARPSRAVVELRAELAATVSGTRRVASRPGGRLFGRRSAADRIRRCFDAADAGRGGTVSISGRPGVGKSAVLELAAAEARDRGWRVARGAASAVEGTWPYAPALEAFGDLCRRHPALLDGLEDVYRDEIERALRGRDVTWSGESGHQRLFVAAAELLRLAATGHGLLLVVDDIQDADEGSLRLLHYLGRCAVGERAVLAVALRPTLRTSVREVADAMAAGSTGTRLELGPLSESATRRLLAAHAPELSTDAVERIWAVSGGLPFTVLELADAERDGGGAMTPAVPPDVATTLRRVALLGTTFSSDEFLAMTGGDDATAFEQLAAAESAMIVEPVESKGYRFRHALVREALLKGMSAAEADANRRFVAGRLEALGQPPARIARHLVGAGLGSRAVPYALRAAETAGALGAYRDALSLLDMVQEHANGADHSRLLARRGDLLLALADPEAVPAYEEAARGTTGIEHRLVRARLARAAAFAGDLDTAKQALRGLELLDDEADSSILLARGTADFFSGNIDEAWETASRARELLDGPDSGWHILDLVGLQGLIAHTRGEWFDRFRQELRRTTGRQRLATTLFDAHLCVAEYVLYGRMPYAEVVAETEELRRQAAHAGALRGVAFATALLGEAALLMGDLDRAEAELTEAVELHHDIDAPAGEGHSLQRLAEVALARGRREEARVLLQRALPLARWSVVGMHLLQRIYGTMIMAADNPDAARAVVDRAEGALGETDQCVFCAVMLAVPATIACAEAGDVGAAKVHLARAERSARLWEGSAWEGALLEARGYLAAAQGDPAGAAALFDEAATVFAAAGHQLEAERCRTRAARPVREAVP